MIVRTEGAIKAIEMPQGYKLEASEDGSRGNNWWRSYCPSQTDQIKICVRYAGNSLTEMDALKFRAVFQLNLQTLFDKHKNVSQGDVVVSLREALGHVGNNQIANRETGILGPIFELERMDLALLKGRKVVRVWGWFHCTDRIPQHYFSGVFVDASAPSSHECRVEEIYLEAYTEESYKQYLASFESVLESIVWSR